MQLYNDRTRASTPIGDIGLRDEESPRREVSLEEAVAALGPAMMARVLDHRREFHGADGLPHWLEEDLEEIVGALEYGRAKGGAR